ncbi:MATE family efflux transporter [Agarilytica rhodophyticola]|uniref:MATE family efflux transporter n=1 Tax=Agarilytica rhodophyticola TaxID=1737490 RepID=UPI00131A24A3|nr:MATE family efflux transporter [Agarilytica rhodophyticola]
MSNMSVPLMGLADTAMLGHLEDPLFLGAVAIGSNVIALFYWMFAFLRMGTTSITAQAIGAKAPEKAILCLTQNTSLALLIGCGLIVLQSLLVPFTLWVIASDQDLIDTAIQYCSIRIYSAPAVLISYVAMGWLIGLKNTKVPLVITISANIINVVLDYIFIIHLGLDAKGAALATLIAECASCVFALLYIWHFLNSKQWQPSRWITWKGLSENLKLGLDLMIRTLSLLFVINFFNSQSAHFGNDVLAANAILFQCVLFVAFFLDGYALAAETLTAQAIGAKNIHAFHQASIVSTLTAFLISILLSLFFILLGSNIIDLLTDIQSVADSAKKHVAWLFIVPLSNIWAYAFDGIFVGAGQTRIMRNAMLFSVLFGFLLVWWFFQFMGNHGLWLAFTIFNLSRGASLALAYISLTQKNYWLNNPYKK